MPGPAFCSTGSRSRAATSRLEVLLAVRGRLGPAGGLGDLVFLGRRLQPNDGHLRGALLPFLALHHERHVFQLDPERFDVTDVLPDGRQGLRALGHFGRVDPLDHLGVGRHPGKHVAGLRRRTARTGRGSTVTPRRRRTRARPPSRRRGRSRAPCSLSSSAFGGAAALPRRPPHPPRGPGDPPADPPRPHPRTTAPPAAGPVVLIVLVRGPRRRAGGRHRPSPGGGTGAGRPRRRCAAAASGGDPRHRRTRQPEGPGPNSFSAAGAGGAGTPPRHRCRGPVFGASGAGAPGARRALRPGGPSRRGPRRPAPTGGELPLALRAVERPPGRNRRGGLQLHRAVRADDEVRHGTSPEESANVVWGEAEPPDLLRLAPPRTRGGGSDNHNKPWLGTP